MRRYVLVSYDISDPKRWRKVYKIMRGHGDHVQYSVFLCRLTEKDESMLEAALLDVIHQEEDQVLFVRIGPEELKTLDKQLLVLGRQYKPLDLKRLIF